jgi:hypothetical protein
MLSFAAPFLGGCDASHGIASAAELGGRAILRGIGAITRDPDLVDGETSETRILGETAPPAEIPPPTSQQPLGAERADTAHGGF